VTPYRLVPRHQTPRHQTPQHLAPRELGCLRCAATYPVDDRPEGCPACLSEGCPASVVPRYDPPAQTGALLAAAWAARPPGVWRYRELLPVAEAVTLAEGGTPVLALPRLAARLGLAELWLKDERRNPTGSFKDRFATVAVSRAVAAGARTVAVASSGNGGVAAAAYAARAGLGCVVVAGATLGASWRAAIESYGARLEWTETSAQRWAVLADGVARHGWYPLTNYVDPPVGSNWWGVEGYKTLAYELAERWGWRMPDWVAVPVSRGDGLVGLWRGCAELRQLGLVDRLPRLIAVERYPSLTRALAGGCGYPRPVEPGAGDPPSRAVSIGNRVGTYAALHTLRASGGIAVACDDAAMREMVRAAGAEGVFLELSSAAGLAGIAAARAGGTIGPDEVVVAVGTATGLTDPAP